MAVIAGVEARGQQWVYDGFGSILNNHSVTFYTYFIYAQLYPGASQLHYRLSSPCEIT